MAALPPSRHERRARPGSLASPVNSRMYRGTWLLVGIPLLVAAFTVYRPNPLREPELQPQFDGAAAALAAQGFANDFPVRTPGSPTAHDATNWVADQLREFGLDTEIDRFHAKIPGRGEVELENVRAIREGRSNQIIVVVAHRDNSGASPGANDNGSGTAALIELARSFAAARVPPQPLAPNNTILFLSTDGGAFGGLGAEHFAAQYQFRDRVVATVNLDAIGGRGPPRLVFSGDTPRFASAELVRTASERIFEQTGVEPTRPGALAQLLDLGFPLSLYEQAPFVDRGIGGITITSAGDRPPPSFADTPENLAKGKLAALGPLEPGVARVPRRRGRARPRHLDLCLPRRARRPRLGHRPHPLHGHAALPGGDRRPLRPASAATHPARPGPPQLSQPARVLALRRAALRALRAPRGLGDGCRPATRAGALARDAVADRRPGRLRSPPRRRLARRARPAAAAEARRRRRAARRPGRRPARPGRPLAARRRDEPVLGAVPAAVAPRVDLATTAPQRASGRCARSPTSPDSAGLSCSSARSPSGSTSASTRPGTSRSWPRSASSRFRRCS